MLSRASPASLLGWNQHRGILRLVRQALRQGQADSAPTQTRCLFPAPAHAPNRVLRGAKSFRQPAHVSNLDSQRTCQEEARLTAIEQAAEQRNRHIAADRSGATGLPDYLDEVERESERRNIEDFLLQIEGEAELTSREKQAEEKNILDWLEQVEQEAELSNIEREAEERNRAAEEVEEEAAELEEATDLDRFLYGGEWANATCHGQSAALQYDREAAELFIEFPDGSFYGYADISPQEAESIYHAGHDDGHLGTKVWDDLRVRGKVYGYQKRYWFLSGPSPAGVRKWMRSAESRKRHGDIGPEGEPFPGWTP